MTGAVPSAALACALVACGHGQAGTPTPTEGIDSDWGRAIEVDGGATPVPLDASIAPTRAGEPTLDEASARRLLDSLFRSRGYTIRNDVSWAQGGINLTLDGYDETRGIGYEYMSSAEVGTDIDEGELRLLLEQHRQLLFVSPAVDEAKLRAQATAFLNALPTEREGGE